MSTDRIPSHREFRSRVQTADELGRTRRLRDDLQRDRPSPDSGGVRLLMTQGDFFDLMEAVAQLRRLRTEAGLSVDDVATKAGLDAATINQVESGQFVNLTMPILQSFARAMGKRLVLRIEELNAA